MKTESERNPLQRSFLVHSLEEFVGDLPEECLLCPVRAVRAYLELTSSIAPRPRSLLVSPQRPTRPLSKNVLSFFLHQEILDAGAVEEGALLPRAHSVWAVATSAAFLRNWLLFSHLFISATFLILLTRVTRWDPLLRAGWGGGGVGFRF